MAIAPLNSASISKDERVRILERMIHAKKTPLENARTQLRNLLLEEAGIANSGQSIGDALAILAKAPKKNTYCTIILIRCLAVPDLIPIPNSTNQIARLTMELCENGLNEICEFIHLDRKEQTFKKFDNVSSAHNKICGILEPCRSTYGDLDALLVAQRQILGSLQHSIVRLYCEPFRLAEIRSTVEAVFGHLRRVAATGPNLLVEAEDCRRTIRTAKESIVNFSSFLAYDFLGAFLENAERCLSDFLSRMRGRFLTKIVKNGSSSQTLQKRYPLHETERTVRIKVPLRNVGPGMATDVRITAESATEGIYISDNTILVGNILPGEFSVTLDALVMSPTRRFNGLLSAEWGEIGNPDRKGEIFEFEVLSQASDVDWSSLEYWTPYSTDVAEGNEFLGRTEKINLIANKLLRTPMDSFYITGQKRVGKTSLIKAAAAFSFEKAPKGSLSCHYILWGAVAHVDPQMSLKLLGKNIEDFLINALPNNLKIERDDYDGSISHLVKIADLAIRFDPVRRFVIIIDEFDEISQDLYFHGKLAETFFANLRAISRCRNICFALVGGENMPFIINQQGDKLNNFARISLSYYTREREWDDFQLLVRTPGEPILNWHDDAIGEVFNITNGNPYFTKIVCAGILRNAVTERDADVTSEEVKRSVESEISALGANSFAHLWHDGIPKSSMERMPDVLRRMRVLLAMARCLRQGRALTVTNVAESRSSSSLLETEVPIVLNDFVRRDVIAEKNGQFEFKLPMFQMWLTDVGASQLVTDSLSEDLAQSIIQQENAAQVLSEEVVALTKNWPTYCGRHVGTDEVRAWYQQVQSPIEQRILFEILKRVKIYSEVQVRERLRTAHDMLRPSLPPFIRRTRITRRNDIIVTYVDGAGKSGASYASLYAEENGIAASCVIPPNDFRNGFEINTKKNGRAVAIVVVDDVASTGESLSGNLDTFMESFSDLMENIKLRIFVLVSTKIGQERILRQIDNFEDIDVDFRACEILDESSVAFPDDGSEWVSEDMASRARALCLNLGSRIYRDNPLGFGDKGLLIVFPTTVPNNSLPILHSYSRANSKEPWTPLFPRPTN